MYFISYSPEIGWIERRRDRCMELWINVDTLEVIIIIIIIIINILLPHFL
jgi:hypothetical protein